MSFKGEIPAAILAGKKTGFATGDIYRIISEGKLGDLDVQFGTFVEWKGSYWKLRPDIQLSTTLETASLADRVQALEAQINYTTVSPDMITSPDDNNNFVINVGQNRTCVNQAIRVPVSSGTYGIAINLADGVTDACVRILKTGGSSTSAKWISTLDVARGTDTMHLMRTTRVNAVSVWPSVKSANSILISTAGEGSELEVPTSFDDVALLDEETVVTGLDTQLNEATIANTLEIFVQIHGTMVTIACAPMP